MTSPAPAGLYVPKKLRGLPVRDGLPVPWASAWSEERDFSIRTCPLAKRPAIFVEPAIGHGDPLWLTLNPVRCREAVFNGRCWVCGHRTSKSWGLGLGGETHFRGFGRFVLKLPPACFTCARFSLDAYAGLATVERVVQVRTGTPICPVHSRDELAEGFPALAQIVGRRGAAGLAYLAVVDGSWMDRADFLELPLPR